MRVPCSALASPRDVAGRGATAGTYDCEGRAAGRGGPDGAAREARGRARRVAVAALVCALACALAACWRNPDPRLLSRQDMARGGLGGWLRVTEAAGRQLQGELIAVERTHLWLLRAAPKGEQRLEAVPVWRIMRAELFTYHSDAGFGAWGVAGTLSTASHGFLLIFSLPVWLVTASASSAAEARHVVLQYPQRPLGEMNKWARFPQGLPSRVRERGLAAGRAVPVRAPAVPASSTSSTASGTGAAASGEPSPAAPAPAAPSPAPAAPRR
jgi:hypothetical protein